MGQTDDGKKRANTLDVSEVNASINIQRGWVNINVHIPVKWLIVPAIAIIVGSAPELWKAIEFALKTVSH